VVSKSVARGALAKTGRKDPDNLRKGAIEKGSKQIPKEGRRNNQS
jgi:hypothetical protein